MPGFGSGRFGQGPFGEWDWEQQVLYDLLPVIDRLQDQEQGLVLQEVLECIKPVLRTVRRRIRDWTSLRNPSEVRSRYDDRTYLRLGPVKDALSMAEQQGLDGSVPSPGAFVATTGRFAEEDRGKVLTISRSSVPANNRQFQIASVVNETTVITDPLVNTDSGPLKWNVRARQSLLSGSLTLEVFQGDVASVQPGDLLTDGEGVFRVTARRRTYNALPGAPLVERGYTDASLNADGTLTVVNGIFDTGDVGKRILIRLSAEEQNGFYEIRRAQTVDTVELVDLEGNSVTFTPEQDVEAVLVPRPEIDIEGTVSPRGIAEQGGVNLDITAASTVTSPTAAFTADDVGKYLQVYDSQVGNDGFYEITAVVDDRTVTLDGSLSLETDLGWWVRQGTFGVVGGDGSDVEVYAESILQFLARDFGIELDRQESEARQRSWVRNATQWFDLKGTARAYEIIGLVSGFNITVEALYSITLNYYNNLPSTSLYQTGESGEGRNGTDGSLTLAADLTGTFSSPTAQLKPGDVGNVYLSISDADTADNNGLFIIKRYISATEMELSRETPVAATDANNGTLRWTLVRLYTSNPPLRPRFDEVNSDRMTTIIEGEPGGNTFRVDKFCWEDDFSADVPVSITSVSSVTAIRWLVEIEDNTTIGDARSPEVAQLVGNWTLIDADGTEHLLETIPTGGPPSYVVEVLAADAPALGDATLRLDCTEQTSCSYCAASVIGLTVEYGDIADESGLAIEKATERVLRRLDEVRPIHVKLVPKITAEVCCYYSLSGIIDTGTTTTSILAPYNATFDDVPADVIPADTYTIRAVIDTP